MAQTVTVTGLKELQARLQAISDELGDKKASQPVTNALRKAGRVLITAMQNNLRRGGHIKSGTLVNNLVTKKVRSPTGTVRIHVGVRSSAKKYVDNSRNRTAGRVGGKYRDYGPLFYARFLEFGTSHQQQTPFMRPAFEENKGALPESIRDDLAARLDKL